MVRFVAFRAPFAFTVMLLASHVTSTPIAWSAWIVAIISSARAPSSRTSPPVIAAAQA